MTCEERDMFEYKTKTDLPPHLREYVLRDVDGSEVVFHAILCVPLPFSVSVPVEEFIAEGEDAYRSLLDVDPELADSILEPAFRKSGFSVN